MTLDPKKIEQWAREADDAAYNFRVEHSNDPTPWSANATRLGNTRANGATTLRS